MKTLASYMEITGVNEMLRVSQKEKLPYLFEMLRAR